MESIVIKDLTKKYKEKTVVNSLNLVIEKGKLIALLGTNGAGKTTTIKMLTGLIKPTAGFATLNGKDLKNQTSEVKEFINVSPQETAIAPNLTVKENLEFIAGVYQIKNKKEKVHELIEKFKLQEVEKQKAKTLSGGWQRRLSIAMALINEPEILFLDEPTLGLDVIARKQLWNIIEKLKESMTIILTTHYMEEAESLSDKVAIMREGNLICQGTAEELIQKAGTKTFEEAFIKLVMEGEE